MIREDPEAVGAASVTELNRDANQSVGTRKVPSRVLSTGENAGKMLSLCPHCLTYVSVADGWDCGECGGDMTKYPAEGDA